MNGDMNQGFIGCIDHRRDGFMLRLRSVDQGQQRARINVHSPKPSSSSSTRSAMVSLPEENAPEAGRLV